MKSSKTKLRHALLSLLLGAIGLASAQTPSTPQACPAALPADASLSDHMTHIGTIKSREECVTEIRIVI